MKTKVINSNNFDQNFTRLLKIKKGKNIVKGRFDLENIKFKNRTEFIINLILSINLIKCVTYKVLFWENDKKIESFFNANFPNKEYKKTLPYKNGKKEGVIFIDDKIIDVLFLKTILIHHFNFEMAKEPSFNIRVQLSINTNSSIILLDIYDDRGFDIYFHYLLTAVGNRK